jgi:hypothetical protein
MVQNPRETLRLGACKPLNTPEPVSVEENASGLPVAIRMKRRVAVTAIDNTWRIDDEWWRSEPVSRVYYAVSLASGQRMMLFKDLKCNSWYQQSC